MLRIFDLLMRLYPAAFRAEFEGEMRQVFAEVSSERRPYREFAALLGGAVREYIHLLNPRAMASVAGGLVVAFSSQALLYRALLKHGFVLCLFLGIMNAQPIPKQDPAALKTAKSIYTRAFTAMRDAKDTADLMKLADSVDSPDWISVDRFGRTLLTRKQANREFESILAMPPESRAPAMDIIWAERDATRLIVVAWMFPREEVRADKEGEYGPKGENHRLTRATLIRDIFETTAGGWRRIQHDKWLQNGTVLTVDGKSLAGLNRITPAR